MNGKCRCADGYEGFTNHCKQRLCKKGICSVAGSTCEETDIPGVVGCSCEGTLFFDGSDCEFGRCIIPKLMPYCYDNCPPDMVRNEKGYCEAKDENRKCEKECMHGFCIKEGEKEVCKCIPEYAVLKNGTCILNANMCASKKLTPDLYKCDCSGMFKYADNDFTCESKSCKDEDVQEECRRRGATSCRDNWGLIGSNVGFECVCAPGFRKDASGTCRNTCELENQVEKCSKNHSICYLDEKFEPYCRCPPTFSFNEEKQVCEYNGKNAFLLKNLPVLKQKYMRKDGSVDKMLLHADVIHSIKTMYAEEVLDSAYLSNVKILSHVLYSDVVLQFKRTTTMTAGRFNLQVIKNISRAQHEDRVAMLPPSLVLINNVEIVSIENVDFCSESITNLLCGEEAQCADRKCFCPPGYRMKTGSLTETDKYTILKCEDIDECKEGFHSCTENTTCVNTPRDYYCGCNPGFKKIGELFPFQNEMNKNNCVDLCDSNPCKRGQCNVKDKMLNCKCDIGFVGFLCDVEDAHLKKAKNVTKIISGVLGSLLLVTIALFIVYVVRKQKKKRNNSEDIYVSQVSPTERNGHRNVST
ncbi:fibrillin-3-like isoform X2 [Uloborus diversus]|uniref:fibrillin-3-like isoform X2 n=1 Tax=Uloborus diversus TaxID=327109 RepID=UPI00240A61B3|nr:fibrillin-3-like isoform X2 [Uloborus diversus]